MCPPVLVKRCITPNLCKSEIKNRKCVKKKHATESLQFLINLTLLSDFKMFWLKQLWPGRGKGQLRHSTVATQIGKLGTF